VKREYIYLSLAIILWSLIPAISKLASSHIDIGVYLFYSNFLSAIAILPFIKIKEFNKSSFFRGIIYGFLGVFAYYLLIYNAYKYSRSSQDIIIIQYLWSPLTALFGFIILKERLSFKKIAALFIAFLALVVTVTKGFSNLPSFNSLYAQILAFIAAIFFAFYSVISKKLSSKSAANDIFLTFIFAFIYSCIYLLFTKETPKIPKDAIFYLTINGLFINGISYLFWLWALQKIEASKASVFTLFTAIVASFWVFLLIGESLKFEFFISLALLLIATKLVLK